MFSINPEEEEEKSFNELLRELDEQIANTHNPEPGTALAQLYDTFTTLADLVGLEHLKGNIYRYKYNDIHFIRTGFGFQPAEQFNKGIRMQALANELNSMKEALNKLRKENDIYKIRMHLLSKRLELVKGQTTSRKQMIKALEFILEMEIKERELEKDSFLSDLIRLADTLEVTRADVNRIENKRKNTKLPDNKDVLKAEIRTNELIHQFSNAANSLKIRDRAYLKLKIKQLMDVIQKMKTDTM